MRERKYNTLEVLKRMFQNMKKQMPMQIVRIVLYTVLAMIYPFFAVFLPKIAIGVLEQGEGNTERTLIIAMLLYFILAAVVGYTMLYIEKRIEIKNMRLRLRYLGDTLRKLTTMDYKYVEDAKFYERNEKALRAGDNNAEGIEGVYNRVSMLPAKFFAMIIMMILAGMLSPVILAALVLHVAVTMWVSKSDYTYRYDRREEEAKAKRRIDYFYKTTHDFSYGKDIRIYNFRDRIMKNYQAEINALTSLIKQFARRKYVMGLIGIVTLLLTNVLMYGILIYRGYEGMPVSSFTMYVALLTSLMASMLNFAENISFILNQSQYVGDFYRLMDESLEREGKGAKNTEQTLEIVFDNVSFRYPGCEEYVFRNFDFTIHRGERLAIVGINGAGKTTLVKLMTGLFEPTEGNIYINGTDIRDFDKKDLYDLYSAVFQDVNVYAYSIRENVTCALENEDDSRVQEALEKVGLWKKVEGFERGLDQMMLKIIDENGTDFSGGERQKLSIARGLYKNAPMVIMDEPTAALDALAEAEIYENFSSLVEGKTAVYISHRLASTKFCDKIALFDKDGLSEYGSHEELMSKQGKYYEMFTVQGKYYQEEVEAV